MAKSGSTYDAILKAATRLFPKKGYTETTIEDIAKEAGFTGGILYHYFKNKEDILYTTMINGLEAVISSTELNENDQTISPTEELRLYIRNFLNAIIFSKVGVMPAAERWRIHLTVEHNKKIIELRHVSDNIIKTILLRGIREGFFREDMDIELVSHHIIAMIMQTRVWYTSKRKLSVMKVADDIFSMFFEGIRFRRY